MKTSSLRVKNLALKVSNERAKTISIISLIGIISFGILAVLMFIFVIIPLFYSLNADMSLYVIDSLLFLIPIVGIIICFYLFEATRHGMNI